MKPIQWHMRHPIRVAMWLNQLGLQSVYDPLICKRCGLIIKPEGQPLTALDISKYSHHIGNLKCFASEKATRIITSYNEVYDILYEAPLCQCGCGLKTRFKSANQTSRFLKGHYQKLVKEQRTKYWLNLIENNAIQSELMKKLKVRFLRDVAARLERNGYLKRERILYKGRYTYRLTKIKNEVN